MTCLNRGTCVRHSVPCDFTVASERGSPSYSLERTCFGVAASGIISFLPGFANLAHAR